MLFPASREEVLGQVSQLSQSPIKNSRRRQERPLLCSDLELLIGQRTLGCQHLVTAHSSRTRPVDPSPKVLLKEMSSTIRWVTEGPPPSVPLQRQVRIARRWAISLRLMLSFRSINLVSLLFSLHPRGSGTLIPVCRY